MAEHTEHIDNDKLPSLTKQEVIYRIQLMMRNCQNKEAVLKLKDAVSYIKRMKD